MKFGIWLLLFAQTAGEATTTGRVTDALTHQPIAGAHVSLCCPPVAVPTFADGTYKLPRRPNGPEPSVNIAKAGYATLHEALSDKTNFELMPAAHIAGRLMDPDSDRPVSGFSVIAFLDRDGRLEQSTSEPSGDDGSFRIANDLTPGDYLLEIVPPSRGRIVSGKPRPDEEAYGRTWYPGVPRREMAAMLTVAAGETRSVDLRLQKRDLRHVAGTIEVPEGHEKDTFSFVLTNGPGPHVASATDFKPGPFRIEGLDEGSYEVYATTGTGASLVEAIELGNRSIDDLKLRLRNEITIRASVKVKEDGVPAPQGLVFFPFPAVRGEFVVEPSDKLMVEGLPAARYWPELITPPGFAVIAASYGERSVLNSTVDFQAPESTVDFTITSRPASVSGVVRDSSRKPLAGVLVALTPDAAPGELSMVEKHQLSAKSDANGAFRIAGLAPGKYHVSGFGDPVELEYGQNATLELHAK